MLKKKSVGHKSAPAKKKPISVKSVAKPAAPVMSEKSGEEATADLPVRKGVKLPTLVRGMKDILPKEETVWKRLAAEALAITEAYGFSQVETPIVEEASLFIRSLGRGTDVVEKEMYVFEDKDGSRVCLRPEMTASFARAYIMHGQHSLPQPVKVWQLGPVFRHDRPQAGRYREFHQFDCETFGERDSFIDAELIVVAYNFLRDLGVASLVHINSIGLPADRERYVVELAGYLRAKRSYLCEDCKRRLQRNSLRVFDCKESSCIAVVEEAPQIIDWLSDASKSYFMKVLEYLDEVSVPYMVRSTLVRGLDYYTDTVFELYPETTGEAGSQSALGGGGRYDLLVEQLGGRPTAAAGFALGLERVATAMRQNVELALAVTADPLAPSTPKVFFTHLGEQARRRALATIESLRRQGIVIGQQLGKASLKAQLELANRAHATHTLILGQKEVQDGTIIIRDMESGIQEIVSQKKLAAELEKMLRPAAT